MSPVRRGESPAADRLFRFARSRRRELFVAGLALTWTGCLWIAVILRLGHAIWLDVFRIFPLLGALVVATAYLVLTEESWPRAVATWLGSGILAGGLLFGILQLWHHGLRFTVARLWHLLLGSVSGAVGFTLLALGVGWTVALFDRARTGS